MLLQPAAVDDDCVQPSAKRPCTAVASGDSIENGGESEAEEKKREAGGDEDASTISSTACEQ